MVEGHPRSPIIQGLKNLISPRPQNSIPFKEDTYIQREWQKEDREQRTRLITNSIKDHLVSNLDPNFYAKHVRDEERAKTIGEKLKVKRKFSKKFEQLRQQHSLPSDQIISDQAYIIGQQETADTALVAVNGYVTELLGRLKA